MHFFFHFCQGPSHDDDDDGYRCGENSSVCVIMNHCFEIDKIVYFNGGSMGLFDSDAGELFLGNRKFLKSYQNFMIL